MAERIIIHLDLDAFFCAVEEQRDPDLRGIAFAVGGRPDQRGVVASCSYAARLMGIHSAMPMARALHLCPQLRIVSGHYKAYREASQAVMERLRRYTPLVEQISIDEAFLDVSSLGESGEALARQIQAEIQSELGLPCSLGVATNKLVAKIATDVGKASRQSKGPPCAIQVVPAGDEAAFLAPLPVQALWGVGPKTAARLGEQLAVVTIGDLALQPEEALTRLFGKHGHYMTRRAIGMDDEPIHTSHEAKSVSQETTFARDVSDGKILRAKLRDLAEGVCRQLQKDGLGGATVKLKLRWSDFTTLTRQATIDHPTDQLAVIYSIVIQLFDSVWKPRKPVRLLGVGVSNLGPPIKQLGLWENEGVRNE